MRPDRTAGQGSDIGRSLAGSHHVGDVTGEVGGEDLAERSRVDVSVGAGGVAADDEVVRVGEAAARVHSRQRLDGVAGCGREGGDVDECL